MNRNNEMCKGNGLNNDDTNDIYGLSGVGAPVMSSQTHLNLYRSNNNGSSTMVDAFGLSDISAPLAFGTNSKQKTDFSPISFGCTGNKFPIDDILPIPMNLPKNDFNYDDFNEFKSEKLIFVASKCIINNNNHNQSLIQSTPLIYNEITSMVINESPNNLMNQFDNILNTFSNDIDYNIDELNYIINGEVFIRNFQIFFKISIWNDINGTRFEVRRTKGDTIIFNEFWDAIKQLILKKFNKNNNNNNNNEFNFDLPPIEYNLTLDDLNDFIIDINESDPCSVYSIAMIINALKIQKQFAQIVFNHKQFLKCVIEKTFIHQDTALIRGGIITLEILCQQIKNAPDEFINSFNILDSNLIQLLSSNSQLIQKYCIRLLYQLSNAKVWIISNKKLKKFAQINIKQFQQKWEKSTFYVNHFIKQQMFENIHAMLLTAN